MGLSLWDGLTFFPKLGIIAGKSTLAIVGGPVRGKKQAQNYGDHVKVKTMNALVNTLSVGQLQAMMPPFEKNYRDWAKKNKIPADVEDVPGTEIKGFWMGDKNTAKNIMVYYHGGGFVMPGFPDHVAMLARWVEWGNGKLAVFCPCYTLSPQVLYPHAIGECVEALRYISEKYSEREILIGGDSAGGNLVLAMLSHTGGHAHSNTGLVKELKLKKPLKGAVMIAPWVSSDGDKFPGAVENSYRDVVTVWGARYWLDTYEGGKNKIKEDEFTMPEIADASWWTGSRDVVSKVLATAGEMEALRDPIKSWAKKFEEGYGKQNFKWVVCDHEIHDAPLQPKPMEVIKVDTNGTKTQEGAIYKWLMDEL
jgi:acetyl esterase/lipase